MTHHDTNKKDAIKDAKNTNNNKDQQQNKAKSAEQKENEKVQENLNNPDKAFQSQSKEDKESTRRSAEENSIDAKRDPNSRFVTTNPNPNEVIVTDRGTSFHPDYVGDNENTERAQSRQERNVRIQEQNLGQQPHGRTPAETQTEPVKDTIDAQIHTRQRTEDIKNTVTTTQIADKQPVIQNQFSTQQQVNKGFYKEGEINPSAPPGTVAGILTGKKLERKSSHTEGEVNPSAPPEPT